ncbi:MAG: Gfo/Idh/MocA family oxidoreductase [Gammaproteobacteria bacterium]|nr:Gfo/Idh/MocA family oxidoreductase [Gammaproteobacteria bacterium]
MMNKNNPTSISLCNNQDSAIEPAGRKQTTRRQFIRQAGTLSGIMIVPRAVLGGENHIAPSDRLNIAAVGAGGKGRSDIESVAYENIYAICDIDDNQLAETLNQDFAASFRQQVKTYRDYRQMLDAEPEIDAVLISTPDHMHAPIAMHAMNLGKHVFVQKPLCHTVAECRILARTAAETDVVTQMGNQGHAEEGARQINEWVASGELGIVEEAHCWTNRPVWPQGIARPEGEMAVPGNISWDLWLGAASFRPYVERAYHPFNWRGWLDFGTGVVGDMGAHIIDHPYWALDLDLPVKISASSSSFGTGMETFPVASKIHFEFAARGERPPVKLTWYDGGLLPERPPQLENGRQLGDDDGGVLLVGSKHTLMHGVYGRNPRLIPEASHLETPAPNRSLPRSPGIHKEWLDAIKDRSRKTTSGFDYAARLTESMLLGNIATIRAGQHRVLEYDSKAMRFTNDEGANAWLEKSYRQGFGLVG